MSVRVKICGITRAEDRDAAVAAGADAIGLIAGVPVETPRELTVDEAAPLARDTPPFVTSVLVTAFDGIDEVFDRHEAVGTDVVQVHATESPDRLETLADQLDAKVVAALDHEEPAIEAYATIADALLVDSTTDEGMGGTGETHDWDRTREIVECVDVPVVLAGGLTPDNVEEAIRTVDPFAVDVASGVETDPGRKDHEAVRRLIDRATGVAS